MANIRAGGDGTGGVKLRQTGPKFILSRKMRVRRPLLLRLMILAASAVTALFLLSTLFAFGITTSRDASLGWTSSSANADLVQVICYRGQFHLTIEFLHMSGFPPPSQPR